MKSTVIQMLSSTHFNIAKTYTKLIELSFKFLTQIIQLFGNNSDVTTGANHISWTLTH